MYCVQYVVLKQLNCREITLETEKHRILLEQRTNLGCYSCSWTCGKPSAADALVCKLTVYGAAVVDVIKQVPLAA